METNFPRGSPGGGVAALRSAAAQSARAMEHPPGPESVQELYKWPDHVAAAMTEDESLRLRELLERKIVVCSDYSGQDCYREALEVLVVALERRFSWPLPQDCLRFGRACDNERLPQKVLMAMSSKFDDSKSCVFSDLLDRLTPVALDFVKAAIPNEKLSKEDRAQAYSDMLEWLSSNRSWAYAGTSHCLVHKRPCPVHPDGVALGLATAEDEPAAKRMKSDTCNSCSRPLYVNTSGMTCKGWSAVGEQLRFADKSELPFAVWLTERETWAQHGAQDIFFGECTARFPVQSKLAERLSETHDVIWIITGPEQLGWPHRRPRMFCAGINKSTLSWVGPDKDAIQQKFDEKFCRQTQLTGDSLLCAPEEEMYKHYQDLARIQGHHVSTDDFKALSSEGLLEAILAPGQLQIYSEYAAAKSKLQSLGGALIADLGQHPHTASTAGPDWPCQLTHGTVISFSHGHGQHRVASGLEHLGAQGFHLFPSTTKDYPVSKMRGIYDTLRFREQKHISGNGMHLAVVASWLSFVLGNVVRVGGVRLRDMSFKRGSSWSALDSEACGTGDTQENLEEADASEPPNDSGERGGHT